MEPIVKDIQKTMSGVEPIFNHHMSTSNSLRMLTNFFFDMGMKLKKESTAEQRKKYAELTDHLVVVRSAISQNFIHETNLHAHEQNELVYKREISELRNTVKKLQQQIEFLK